MNQKGHEPNVAVSSGTETHSSETPENIEITESDQEEYKPDKKEQNLLDSSRPCDFSFRQIDNLDFLEKLTLIQIEAQKPSGFRVGGVPTRGRNGRYMSLSLWLNNNRLTSFDHLDKFARAILAYPMALSWLDLSHNRISEISDVITKFPNLKILYLHSNDIRSMRAIIKLREMEKLRKITFAGNPIEQNTQDYRIFISHLLPSITSLDFILITYSEKLSPEPLGLSKVLD